ncbi:MAG: hypothetical protein B6D46_03730 [Polyangiaceae bacterium UTPRO1]|jgi:apolipoprotein N-acyltransferase|nr:hypothetical protein [Myxococcales bacterium]OQY68306.1 MAG: hypothetical protein B6D46_03730 [Polyangiaceae bacterium UTPRO1]
MFLRARAYPRFWRLVAAVLVAVSRTGVLVLAGVLMGFPDARLDNPLRLLRAFVALSLAPGLAAWLLARVFTAAVTIADGLLVVSRRDRRIEVPLAALAGVAPWRVPLPGNGLALVLRSGRRAPVDLQLGDVNGLVEALAAAGASAAVRDRMRTPAAVYQSSRRDDRRRWWHPLLSYGVLALVPTLPVFRLNQWIVYGGTFGEYYTYGLRAYLFGFIAYWWTFTIYLVLWAGVLRAGAEAVVMATAWAAPARVPAVRRAVEVIDRIAYYGGVPLFLLRVAVLAS